MMRIAIVFALVACGGGGGKATTPDRPTERVESSGSATPVPAAALDTPDALAKAFLAALVSADVAKVRALYMTPEHVAALVTCDKDPVIELRAHLAALEGKLRPMTIKIEYEGWLESGRSIQKAGTQRDGCTAKKDFELATGSIKFTINAQPDGKQVAIVKVDEGWRVWKLDDL